MVSHAASVLSCYSGWMTVLEDAVSTDILSPDMDS